MCPRHRLGFAGANKVRERADHRRQHGEQREVVVSICNSEFEGIYISKVIKGATQQTRRKWFYKEERKKSAISCSFMSGVSETCLHLRFPGQMSKYS